MPLPTPILDDRSYEQLREELVRRIPVYAPEWTDHNASDPGIALLELFAFLGENLLFRFNQIPETTRLEFLRLLQVPLRAAEPSRALVALTLSSAADVLVDAGTEAKAGSVSFETQDETHVWPLEVRALAKVASAEPQTAEAQTYAALAIDARELTESETAAYYLAEVVAEDPAAPGAEAVDVAASVDGILWVAVLSTDDTDPDLLGEAILNLGFVPDETVEDMEDVDACPGEGGGAASSEIDWEVSTAQVEDGEPVYRSLAIHGDTTRGLTRQGVVRLELPKDPTLPGVPLPDAEELLGTGSFPPELEDEELAARVLFWLRAFRRRDERPMERVLWVGVNATEVVQVKKARTELLGTGTGDADQTYRLVHAPVVAGSLVLEVEGVDGWAPWAEVDGFHASLEEDLHYVVDREAGTVRFGNGVQGRAPQIGERVRATEYRYGGGTEGNVGAKAVSKLVGVSGVKASNPLPARGGAPAESVQAALDRVPGELRRRDRAVTAGDFRELALATPGADVGRAEVLPLFHPGLPREEAAGVVSVVVWPREDLARHNAPMPDRTLLSLVCRWLDARRLITTELYVIPPTYRRVAVSVGLKVKPGYGVEAVRRWVELVVRQYLAPLPPFGPSGEGWPLGRRVHGPELEAAALQVDGVEYLEGLEVAGWDDDAEKWVSGSVELEPWEVPELTEITVVEGEQQPAGTPLDAPPAKTITTTVNGQPVVLDLVPVPIPTIREEC